MEKNKYKIVLGLLLVLFFINLFGIRIYQDLNYEPPIITCETKLVGYWDEDGNFISETLNFPMGVTVKVSVNCYELIKRSKK